MRRVRAVREVLLASGRLVSGPPGRGPFCIVFRPSSVSVDGNLAKSMWILLLFVVKGVFHSYVISCGQRAGVLAALDGMKGRGVQRGGSALGFDADVLDVAIAVNIKEDRGALADRGRRIGLIGLPVLRDDLRDNAQIVGVADAKGAVLDGGRGGAILELLNGLRQLRGVVAGGGLGG